MKPKDEQLANKFAFLLRYNEDTIETKKKKISEVRSKDKQLWNTFRNNFQFFMIKNTLTAVFPSRGRLIYKGLFATSEVLKSEF